MRIRALEQELAEKSAAAAAPAPPRPLPASVSPRIFRPPPAFVPPPSLFQGPPESSGAILEELLDDAPARAPGADIPITLDVPSVERDADRAFAALAAPEPELQPEPTRAALATVTAHNLKITLPAGKLPRALASGLSCPACTAIGAPEELALTETYVKARETLRLLACPACASIYGLRQAP